MSLKLVSVSYSDCSLLFGIYISSRAEELNFVPWTDEQKNAFLEAQFQAQTNHTIIPPIQTASSILSNWKTKRRADYFGLNSTTRSESLI